MECLDKVEVLDRNCRCCLRLLNIVEDLTTFVTHEIQAIFFDLMNEKLDDGLICGNCSDHLDKFERFKAEIKWNRRKQLERVSSQNSCGFEVLEEFSTESLIENDNEASFMVDLSFTDDNSQVDEGNLNENRSNLEKVLSLQREKRKGVQRNQVLNSVNSPKAVCPQCGKAITLKALKTHIKRHQTNRERQFMCEVCSKTYLNKYELIIHQRKHLNFRPFECDIDGKCFTSKNNLTKHIQSQHLNLRRSVDLKVFCPVCEKLFPFQSKMIEHFKKAHPGGYSDGVKVDPRTNHFHCQKCKCEFLTKFRIDNHICLEGGKESLHKNQCPVCSFACQSRVDLIKHFHDHGEKLKEKNKWRCKVCQVVVNNKIAVHVENTHSSGTVSCGLCNKSLKNRKSLRQHLYLSHQNGYEIRKGRKHSQQN